MNEFNMESYNNLVKSLKSINKITLDRLELHKVSSDIPEHIQVHFNFSMKRKELNDNNLIVNGIFHLIAHDSSIEVTNDTFGEIVNDLKSGNHHNMEIIFNMSVEYEFKNPEYLSGDLLEFFIKRNCPIHIWPYVRELVSSLTIRMGFNTPLILQPLLS